TAAKMATATRLIQRLRNFLAGRDLQAKLQLRYEEIAKSTTLQLGLLMKFKCDFQSVAKASSLSSFLYSSSGAAVTTTGKKPVTPGPPLRKWEISRDEPYL
ncbi:NDUA7 dehydrogenase, partial [Ploceus nigricollis]|nr:NDUA7 dehydrogenase [Ploceus nigricollis]